MSPIGRIFVVINLALAAAFLGAGAASLASSDSYRTQYEQEVAASAEAKKLSQESIDALNAQVAEAQRIREETRGQNAQLLVQKEALDADIAAKTDELNQLKAQASNVSSQLESMTGQIEAAVAQGADANEARVAAIDARNEAQNEAAAAVEARAAAEDQVNALTAENASLREDLASSQRELQSTNTMLAAAMKAGGLTIADVGTAAPAINGAVLGVDSVAGATIVHINRGSNDSVKPGYIFQIYDNATYKGEARVVLVHNGSCTARMTTMRDGATVGQGDRAATQLGG